MDQNSARKNQSLALAEQDNEVSRHGDLAQSHKLSLRFLAKALLKYNASDLHLKKNRPPLFRINGYLVPAKMDFLTEEALESILFEIIDSQHKQDLEQNKQIDFSFHVSGCGRFRCNIYFQKGSLSAAIRKIPEKIPRLENLGLPEVLKEFLQKKQGLILITGSTGSGKSTTLASMIQHLNETQHIHILTIEDPIEFIYQDSKAAISQREIGSDAANLKDAIRAGLRQDPDVIVIGEMRDAETIEVALTAAETGHLVISTLHTNDAKSSISRILDIFKGESQNQVRIQLAATLVGITSQQLILSTDKKSRVVACEVLVKSPAIESYILKNEMERIQEAISSSQSYYHMQTMNQALEKLVQEGKITLEEALKNSRNPDDLKLRLSGIHREGDLGR